VDLIEHAQDSRRIPPATRGLFGDQVRRDGEPSRRTGPAVAVPDAAGAVVGFEPDAVRHPRDAALSRSRLAFRRWFCGGIRASRVCAVSGMGGHGADPVGTGLKQL